MNLYPFVVLINTDEELTRFIAVLPKYEESGTHSWARQYYSKNKIPYYKLPAYLGMVSPRSTSHNQVTGEDTYTRLFSRHHLLTLDILEHPELYPELFI